MNKYIIVVLGIMMGMTLHLDAQPCPRNFEKREGTFQVSELTTIETRSECLSHLPSYIKSYIRDTPGKVNNRLVLCVDDGTSLGKEEYTMEIKPDEIIIKGGGPSGVFYGIQQLFRYLPAEIYSKKGLDKAAQVQCGFIKDGPECEYRGVMLDVVRAWVDKTQVLRQIEFMSYHNLNTLHWHLTDNEGWRIEIKSHPELAAIGGFRGGDSPVMPQYGMFDRKYGGYYTQEDVKEIVQYARERAVRIIPEIDLPGHSRAAARVMPEILCDIKVDTSKTAGRNNHNVWCVGKESNYKLLDDIIREVAELFPSEYIHIGGDEVGMGGWLACPHCKALMEECGYVDGRQLEDHFMKRVVSIVQSYGKIPMAWWDKDVITGDTFPKESILCGWQAVKACRQPLSIGYPTVFMSAWHFYFDMKQGPYDPGVTWGGIIDYKRVYKSRAENLGIPAEERKNIIGYEGAFWGETHAQYCPDRPDYLDYMLYPRVAALGAVSWGCSLTAEEYSEEMTARHYPRLAAMGVRFRLPEPDILYDGHYLTARVHDAGQVYYSYKGGAEKRYFKPIKTSDPDAYEFRSKFGSGLSSVIKDANCLKKIKPAFKLTSSLPADNYRPVSGVESYEQETHFGRSCHKGDWILLTFDELLVCRRISIKTGMADMVYSGFPAGDVYVSYDGEDFHKVGEIDNERVVIEPQKPIKAIRLVCKTHGNANRLTVIQPIEVYPHN